MHWTPCIHYTPLCINIHLIFRRIPVATDDSVPAIRAIIFGGLVEKNVDDDILGEILDRHKNDTLQFILSPTDVVMTWTVSRYLQIKLKSKAGNKTFNTADDFESRLENLRSRLQKTICIYIPGEYHGMVTKDDLLLMFEQAILDGDKARRGSVAGSP